MSSTTRVIFLGGTGEIGRNMLAVESDGKILVVDCGLSFPSEEMYGVDLVLPDFSYLSDRAKDVLGVVLTHGHEDHVGALSWFIDAIPAPVYGTPLTLGLARRRMDEFGTEAELVEIGAPGTLDMGPFKCTFVATSHSIPDSVAVVVDSAGGRVLYTADFKLDPSPIDGRSTDLDTLRRLGEEGVDLLLSDSTNVLTPGRTPSEAIVGPALRDIVEGARRRVLVACFASNLHRIQQVCEAAEATGRVVAFVGRSMIANVEVGRELGHLRISDATIVPVEELDRVPPERSVIICTGSQGEPFSALALIAAGEHKRMTVRRGDTVILSASAIPGNEAAVHRVINSFYRVGAEVFDAETSAVHVSGHAASEELEEMLLTVKPHNFTPVHGEFRHLAAHARLAERNGIPADRIVTVEDGDVLELSGGRVRKGDKVRSGMVLVDGLGVGDVGPVMLRDRRHLAEDGILVCVITIDATSGEVLAGPDLISRGFVYVEESREFLDEAAERAAEALDALDDEAAVEWSAIKKTVRRALGEFVWEKTKRRPMILPIIMEI